MYIYIDDMIPRCIDPSIFGEWEKAWQQAKNGKESN
jgi:hypothetical protein